MIECRNEERNDIINYCIFRWFDSNIAGRGGGGEGRVKKKKRKHREGKGKMVGLRLCNSSIMYQL